MKRIKEYIKRNMRVYFEVEDSDLKEFLQYLKDNSVRWSDDTLIDVENDNKKYIKKPIGIEYIKEKGYRATIINNSITILNWCSNGFKLYFDEIKEDKLFFYRNNTLYIRNKLTIPEYRTYFKKDRFDNILLPVLDNPSDIKKLFKGFNEINPFKQIRIFYKGNIKESNLLKNKMNNKDFIGENGERVAVYPSFYAHVSSNDEYKYVDCWKYIDAYVARNDEEEMIDIEVCDARDCLDKIIFPVSGYCKEIDQELKRYIYYYLRCIEPHMDITCGITIKTPNRETRKAVEIQIHNPKSIDSIYILLSRLHIKEIYYIKRDKHYHLSAEEIEYLGNNKQYFVHCTSEKYMPWSYKNNTIVIDDKEAMFVGHIMYMALGGFYSSHKDILKDIPRIINH